MVWEDVGGGRVTDARGEERYDASKLLSAAGELNIPVCSVCSRLDLAIETFDADLPLDCRKTYRLLFRPFW